MRNNDKIHTAKIQKQQEADRTESETKITQANLDIDMLKQKTQ